jgi:hypothetical protein
MTLQLAVPSPIAADVLYYFCNAVAKCGKVAVEVAWVYLASGGVFN